MFLEFETTSSKRILVNVRHIVKAEPGGVTTEITRIFLSDGKTEDINATFQKVCQRIADLRPSD
jgi:hypothetical protein